MQGAQEWGSTLALLRAWARCGGGAEASWQHAPSGLQAQRTCASWGHGLQAISCAFWFVAALALHCCPSREGMHSASTSHIRTLRAWPLAMSCAFWFVAALALHCCPSREGMHSASTSPIRTLRAWSALTSHNAHPVLLPLSSPWVVVVPGKHRGMMTALLSRNDA